MRNSPVDWTPVWTVGLDGVVTGWGGLAVVRGGMTDEAALLIAKGRSFSGDCNIALFSRSDY